MFQRPSQLSYEECERATHLRRCYATAFGQGDRNSSADSSTVDGDEVVPLESRLRVDDMRRPVHALRDADSVEGSRKRPEFLVRAAAAAALAEEQAAAYCGPPTATAGASSLPDASPSPSSVSRASLAGVALECVDLILAYQQAVAAKYARFGWGGGSRGLRAANRLPNLFLEDLKRWCLDELAGGSNDRNATRNSPQARFEHASASNPSALSSSPAAAKVAALGAPEMSTLESALALGSGEAAALRGVHYLGLVLYGDDDDYSSDRGSEGGDNFIFSRSAKDYGSFAWCFQGEQVPTPSSPLPPPSVRTSTPLKNGFACAACRLGNSGNKHNGSGHNNGFGTFIGVGASGSSSSGGPGYIHSSSVTGHRKTTSIGGSTDLGSLLVAVRGALAAGVSQRLRRRLDQTALRPQLEDLKGHAKQCFRDGRQCLAFLLLVGTQKVPSKEQDSLKSVDDTNPIDSLVNSLFPSSSSKKNDLRSVNGKLLPSSEAALLLASLIDGSSVARGCLDMRLGFAVQSVTSLLEPRDHHHLRTTNASTVSGGSSGRRLRCEDRPDVFAAALGVDRTGMVAVVPPAMLAAVAELTEAWADNRDSIEGSGDLDRSPPPSPLSPAYPAAAAGASEVVDFRTPMKGASSNESLQSLDGGSPSSTSSAGKHKQADTLVLKAYSLLQRTALYVGWLEEALAAASAPVRSTASSLTLADVRDELTIISAALSGTLPALRHELKALYKIAASMNRRRNYTWHSHMPSAMAALGQVGHHVAAAGDSCKRVGTCLAALAATELALGLDGALVDAGRSEFLDGDVQYYHNSGDEKDGDAGRKQFAAPAGSSNDPGSSSSDDDNDDDDDDDICQREAEPSVAPPEPWEVVESQSQPGTYYFRNKATQFTTWSLPDWEQPQAATDSLPSRSGGSRRAVLSLRRRIALHAELF